jgi:hypothetical protein
MLLAKVLKNKKTQQLSISLPKKQLRFLKDEDTPKYVVIKLRKKNFRW